MMTMASKAVIVPVAGYPGLFYLNADSGDIQTRQVLTRPLVEALRASATDALAEDARRRRRASRSRKISCAVMGLDRRLALARSKHPAAPCPARYKHAPNAGRLPRGGGRMRVYRSLQVGVFGRNWRLPSTVRGGL